MKTRSVLVLSLLFGLCWHQPARAQSDLCGPPPSLPAELQTDEVLKGQLESEARLLKGLIGRAELGGQIESSRRKLYQSSDNFFAARKEAYLAYMFCVIVVQDRNIPYAEKLKALQEFSKSPADPNRPRSVKELLKDGSAIVVQMRVPRDGSDLDKKFLKEGGGTISITIMNYDARTGRGQIASTNFGYPVDAHVVATDTTLSIVNSAPKSCSGSFQLKEKGVLRGQFGCKWGNPYPVYDATIILGD